MRFDCIHCRKATTKPQSVKGAFLRMLTKQNSFSDNTLSRRRSCHMDSFVCGIFFNKNRLNCNRASRLDNTITQQVGNVKFTPEEEIRAARLFYYGNMTFHISIGEIWTLLLYKELVKEDIYPTFTRYPNYMDTLYSWDHKKQD